MHDLEWLLCYGGMMMNQRILDDFGQPLYRQVKKQLEALSWGIPRDFIGDPFLLLRHPLKLPAVTWYFIKEDFPVRKSRRM